MKKKHFGPKTLRCWSYFTSAGEGWEVGFVLQGKSVFVGNFVHQPDATRWFTMMNREVAVFAKRNPVGPKFPVTFWRSFLGNHLYTTYYSFLDRLFAKHTTDYRKATLRDRKKFSKISALWSIGEKVPFYKAA